VSDDPPVPALDSVRVGPGWDVDVPEPVPAAEAEAPRIELVRDNGRPPDEGDRSAPRPRFRVYTCAELDALPPLAWLIERHIPLGGFTVLYGAPSAGKSFLSLAWALTLAAIDPTAATAWLRWRTYTGPVVYVAAEGGSGLRQRIRAYRDAHALADEPALYVVREPVNLLEATDALLADVRRALPSWPTLFAFDTLARCLGGADENGPEAMGGAVLAIDRIRHVTGAAVLGVHHTGRHGETPRGHSMLDGAADSMFYLKDDGGARVLECMKPPRDGEPVDPQRLRLRPLGGSCVLEPLEGDAGSALGPLDRKLLQVHRDVSLDGETTTSTWLDSSGVSRATYHRCLKRLIEGGYVVKRSRRYALTPLGEAQCLTRS